MQHCNQHCIRQSNLCHMALELVSWIVLKIVLSMAWALFVWCASWHSIACLRVYHRSEMGWLTSISDHLQDGHMGSCKRNFNSLSDCSLPQYVAYCRTVISHLWGIILYPGFPLLLESLVFLSALFTLNYHSPVNVVSDLQTCMDSYVLLYLYWPKIQEKAGCGGRENPEDLRINSPHMKKPSPAVR